jgi:hypothetical protein
MLLNKISNLNLIKFYKYNNSMSNNTQPYIKTEALDYDVNSQMKIYFGKSERKKNIFKRYITNKISTTKYNLFSFFPKCILMQFRRLANVYFLIISILTFMSFSPKNPVSMIGTFSIVLLFTMAKEAFEVKIKFSFMNAFNFYYNKC